MKGCVAGPGVLLGLGLSKVSQGGAGQAIGSVTAGRWNEVCPGLLLTACHLPAHLPTLTSPISSLRPYWPESEEG